MHGISITAQHWQAALQFPTEIALSVTETTSVRLQAARMVQAMLKILLKNSSEREEFAETIKQIQPTIRPASDHPTVSNATRSSPERTQAADKDEKPNVLAASRAVSAEKSSKTNVGVSPPSVNPYPPDLSSSEQRTRYIGRDGPRKLRGKPK
ncbi:hypothetical protein DTL21_24210 [Bremerella cremea]|uniref:Uncharacterized protein n=1 Tax=Blastopirellula marina TaxID=124 RepID=A0A2S8FEE8_9BACT|nr:MULTISPECIES: hypothetical protein [Pirellulaceae]PQO30460.1 hypothetical protein C5Y83_24165 [Blastopirellula marina]RCS43813.1 hypothetical protein DTL21_24210 [Bremerella cremea]